MSAIVWVWTFFALPFFGTRMKTDLFQSYGHCWVFQICWHIECSTFTASSFRIWNSSTGIPPPPLALLTVMLPKADLTWHSTWLCLSLLQQIFPTQVSHTAAGFFTSWATREDRALIKACIIIIYCNCSCTRTVSSTRLWQLLQSDSKAYLLVYSPSTVTSITRAYHIFNKQVKWAKVVSYCFLLLASTLFSFYSSDMLCSQFMLIPTTWF